jgi:hypothetical protein
MSTSNGNLRKKLEGIKLYTNQLYYKSFPGQPTSNLIPTAEENSDFSARLGGAPHAFYRIYADRDPHQQGMYKSLATGYMSGNDVVYKTNFRGHNLNTSGMHTFSASDHNSLKLKIGQEYIFSCEVFVSKRHARTSGLSSVISVKATDQNGKYYGRYDFSKSGTWQVVSIVFTPSLETLVTATAGTSGSSGSAGTSGVSSLIKTTLTHTVYFWPQEETVNGSDGISDRSRGYILYKNPQLEKGSQRTQFTRKENPRNLAGSLKDISGNKNSFSVAGMSFSSNSTPVYGDDSFSNIGLTSTKKDFNSSLQIGSNKTKTYDFWINGTSLSDGISTLFFSDLSEGERFTNNSNISRKQHIYITDRKIYCDLYDEFGFSTSSFTVDSVVDEATITNIIVSVNTNNSANKVKFYVNGYLKTSKSVSNLQAPTNISLYSFLNVTNTIEIGSSRSNYGLEQSSLEVERGISQLAFKRGLTVNYKISSYNDNGESSSSSNKKVIIEKQNSSISVSWPNVRQAKGFYIYRSLSNINEFDNNSLLLKLRNPYFGNDSNELITFIDDNSINLKEGFPKSESSYSKYKLNNNSFYDGSNLKATVGALPLANSQGKTGLEGVVYKFSVYSKSFNGSEALSSFVEGSRDFDFANNTAPFSVSASAGDSLGGYGGGY